MSMMEVHIYAEDVEDLRRQLVKFAAVYGAKVAENNQPELPFAPTAALAAATTEVLAPAAPAPAETAAPARRGRKPKSETSTTAQEAAPSTDQKVMTPPDAPAQAAEPNATATVVAAPSSNPSITESEARDALGAVNAKMGMPAARALVQKFGVQRFSELKPEVYAEFVKACQEALSSAAS